jgi:hypothetical protein
MNYNYEELVQKLAEEIVDNAIIEKEAGFKEEAIAAGRKAGQFASEKGRVAGAYAAEKGRAAGQFAAEKGRAAAGYAAEKGRAAAGAVGRKAKATANDAAFVGRGAVAGAKRRAQMLKARDFVKANKKRIGLGAAGVAAGAGALGGAYAMGRSKQASEMDENYDLVAILDKAASVYEDAQYMKQAAEEVLAEAALYEDAAGQIFDEAGIDVDENDFVDEDYSEDYVDEYEE